MAGKFFFFPSILESLMEEELKEYKKSRGNSLMFQLIKVANLENLEYWKKYKYDSEDEQVHRVKGLLRIIFRDAKTLKIQTGEHTSAVSKIVQRYNEANFGNTNVFLSSFEASASATTTASSSSKIIGRKVDMMLVGSNNIELAICEFKVGDNATKLEEQQEKCLRLNASILKHLKCTKEEEEVVAFVWGGMSGELFSLRQDKDGMMIAKSLSKLLLPRDIRLINEQFKQSIIALYNWKAFLVQQDDRLELAVPGVRSYCPEAPEICFSPKRQNQTLFIYIPALLVS
ncbi:hypothetical protein EDC96DRAFT_565320 [Choanephora cucurbitarum]|nr:hypothetical protein EDC96DRAFT_565320 [Choanephora cucurbitarum]